MPLSVKTLHSKIEERETNAIYYLLRKFRILKETINIQEDITITGKYGKYKWTTSTGKLDIIDCEPTTNYKIIFSILNTDTTQIRTVEANSNVSSSNTASITIPTLQSNEILQTNVNVEITYPQYIRVNPYQITVTADKSIIQADETATLTAQLKHNGSVVSGKTLNYEVKHGSTVLDSGSDVTDSNGEIDISYTGTAIGQVDIIVTYGSLLQETYEVYDVNFYDTGINGTANTNWAYNTNYLTKQVLSDGTLITNSATATTERPYQVDLLQDADYYDFDVPFALEFDLVSLSGTVIIIMVSNNGENGSVSMSYCNFTANKTCRIEYNDRVMKFYTDNTSSKSDRSFTLTGKVRLGFGVRGESSIKYKNFKVYPI